MKKILILFFTSFVLIIALILDKTFTSDIRIIFSLSVSGLLIIATAMYYKLIRQPYLEIKNPKKEFFLDSLFTFFYVLGVILSSLKIYFIITILIIFTIYIFFDKKKFVLKKKDFTKNTEKIIESIIFFKLFIIIGVLNFF
ncbi:MAG: hypothetical protein GX287_05625 [Fusobacteria bacterium]|nr:hypothetical protein [Fusobacteriota bacterium]